MIQFGAHMIDETLTKEREGLRLEAYTCPAGKLTIGYGHTGDDVHYGQKISSQVADMMLATDLTAAARTVQRSVQVALNDKQFSALVDFVFNLGGGALLSSTLLKILNASDYQGAANEFLKWDKAHVDGKLIALPGLTVRRQREREEFLA